MELLKIIFIAIYTVYIYYRAGVLLKKVLKSESNNLCSTVLYGFILTFAIFELINIPFIIAQRSTTKIVYIIYLILNTLYIILSYIIKPKTKKYNLITNIKNIKIKKNIETVFYILAIVIIIFQIVNSTMLFKQDADDSFYVSWADEASQLENMYNSDPRKGAEETEFDNKYLLNTWEIYGGFTARLFNINTATLFHSAYQIIYILIAYMSYYLLLKKLLNNKNVGLGLLILSLLFLFNGVSVRFKGIFLLGRIFQGKSILVNIIIPFVIYKFIDFKNLGKENYILLMLAYIASIACNPITIWFLSLVYGLLLLIILIKRDFKTFVKSLIVLIPIILIGLIYIMVVLTKRTDLGEITTAENFSCINSFNMFLNQGKSFIILYIIAMFIILLKGDRLQKDIGVIFPVLVCLLVINPLLKDIYVKVVTTATYWRLFWLFPIEITIAMAVAIMYSKINSNILKNIIVILIIVFIGILGKYMYQEELGFSKFQNFEKIQTYILDEIKFIIENEEEKVIVAGPPEPLHSCLVRQYTTQMILLNARDTKSEQYEQYEYLYKDIYMNFENNYYNYESINKMINECYVQYLILPKSKVIEINNECKFELVNENEYDYIIRAK